MMGRSLGVLVVAIGVVLVGCGVSPDAEDVATMDAAVAQVHELADAAGATVIDTYRATRGTSPLAFFPQNAAYVATIISQADDPDAVRAELTSRVDAAIPAERGIYRSVFVSDGDIHVTLELRLRP